jgi:DNA adenine methylase
MPQPPFSYYGGKTILAPKIASLLPDHDHYVEPFAGGMSVLLAKAPSKAETVNDLDGDLVNFWRVLRDKPDELVRACVLTPHSREEYEVSKNLDGADDVERARRVWVRLTQGRANSMQPHGWRYGRDISKVMPMQIKGQARNLEPDAIRLAMVTLENRDAVEMIRDYGKDPRVCIYADPPYLGSTRVSNYRHEMLEDDLHVQLAEALRDCKAAVVLSGYAAPLYEDLYPGWHRLELKAPTSLAGGAAPNEVLWSNVPLGAQQAFDFEMAAA